jgi:hypothetical protein
MTAAEPKNIQEACRNPAYAMVLGGLVEKERPEDLIADLVKDGHGPEEAARMVNKGKILLQQATRDSSPELFVGIFLLFIGGGITLFTLLTALDSGGLIVVCYGAILVGIMTILRALHHRKSSMRGWLREQVAAAIDAARRPQESAKPSAGGGPAQIGKYDY